MSILSTHDYDKFSFLEENRKVSPDKVKIKKELIKRNNKTSINPIQITPDFKIIDGQHRFEACKELGLPIYYIIDENHNEMDLYDFNNSTTKWTLQDLIHFWSVRTGGIYKDLELLYTKHKIPITDCVEMMGINQGDKERLRNGKLKELKVAKENIIERYEIIKKIKATIREKYIGDCSFVSSKSFSRGLIKTINIPNISIVDLEQCIERQLSKVRPCYSPLDYFEMFRGIYNSRKTHKV